jgi:hypothetical protein
VALSWQRPQPAPVLRRAQSRLDADSELRHVAQLTFSHRTLMRLVGAFFTRYSNSPSRSGNFLVTVYAPPGIFWEGIRSKKHSLTDLKLMCLHDAPHYNLSTTLRCHEKNEPQRPRRCFLLPKVARTSKGPS